MPRTAITPQDVTRSGIVPALGAVDSVNGMYFVNDGKTYLEVKNASGSSMNVTVKTAAAGPDGLTVTDRVVAVAAGATKKIGPFPPGIFNQSDGTTWVDFSAATTITVGAFRLT